MQVVGDQCATEAAAAIEDERRVLVRNLAFDVTFDDAFAQMDGAGQMTVTPLAFFAGVDEDVGRAKSRRVR